MSAYRDDLDAARERIRALEEELESIQRKESQTLAKRSERLVQAGGSQSSTALALVGPLVVAFVALRVPTTLPVAVVAVLFGFLVLALRGRSIVVRPNEVAILRARGASADDPPTWVGPGRLARLRRGAEVESMSLRAVPVSWTASNVETEDANIEVDLFAVVAVRRDEEGIERAVRTFGSGPLAPITQAALEDAMRHCAKSTPSAELRRRDAGVRARLRRKGRESLDELGVKLVSIGMLAVREAGGKQA